MRGVKVKKTFIALAAVLIVAIVMPEITGATIVCGGVQDSNGMVEGAIITIYNANDKTTSLTTNPAEVTTDSQGQFSAIVSDSDLSNGVDAYVTASKGEKSGWSQATVQNSGINVAIVLIEISIPEFVTIAIPAVAILGLFLFFNHKRKEE